MKILITLIFLLPFSLDGQVISNNWNDYISFYRKFASPQVGGNCKMIPTCSKYADIQFSTNSFAVAIINTSDRMMRCSHDIKNYNLTFENNNYKLIDFPNDDSTKKHIPVWEDLSYAYNDTNKIYNKSIEFVNFLINRELYEEALIEINKILYLNPNKPQEVDLYVNYFRCLRSLGKYERAKLDFEVIVPINLKNHPKILIELAQIWLKLENYDNSILVTNQIIGNSTVESNTRDEARILKSIVLSKQFKWQLAKETINEIKPFSRFFENKNSNLKYIDLGINYQPKKEWKAKVLSIFPGAGYLYANHPISALSALLTNSLLAYASYTSFKSNNTGIGILTSIIGFGFYLGNISGASKTVTRLNRINQENISKQINLKFSL